MPKRFLQDSSFLEMVIPKHPLINIARALALLCPNAASAAPISAEEVIKSLGSSVCLEEATPGDFARLFFDDANIQRNRLSNGVVETPAHIASSMVQLAAEAYFTKPVAQIEQQSFSSVHWFDPCVGGGAFPVAILKLYISLFGVPSNVEDLPKISISDIAPEGVFLSLCGIRSALKSSIVTIDEYLASGRLNYIIGDTLDKYGESDCLLFKFERYDIVIANPPYVRSTRLSDSYRKFLKNRFPSSYYGSADLYMYFIASGICSLKESGVLTFISPASFLRTKSGSSIRAFIKKTCALTHLIDLDETRIFDDAAVHSAIYVLRSGQVQPKSICYSHIDSSEQLDALCKGQEGLGSAVAELPANHGWAFHKCSSSYSRFKALFKNCKPLSFYDINVYSGVRPGFSKAFIVDEKVVERFSKEIRNEWIKPIVLPANLERWIGQKKLHYLIFTPRGCGNPPEEIMQLLYKYHERLSNRAEVRDPDDWYKLRPCAYYDKMFKQKIAFPDLSAKQRFSLCEPGVLVPDGAYFIDTDDLVLLGVLNSEIAKKYFVNICSSVGSLSSKGRFRFKKTFVKDFPIPVSFFENEGLRCRIQRLVSEFLNYGETLEGLDKLNKLVSELYGA